MTGPAPTRTIQGWVVNAWEDGDAVAFDAAWLLRHADVDRLTWLAVSGWSAGAAKAEELLPLLDPGDRDPVRRFLAVTRSCVVTLDAAEAVAWLAEHRRYMLIEVLLRHGEDRPVGQALTRARDENWLRMALDIDRAGVRVDEGLRLDLVASLVVLDELAALDGEDRASSLLGLAGYVLAAGCESLARARAYRAAGIGVDETVALEQGAEPPTAEALAALAAFRNAGPR